MTDVYAADSFLEANNGLRYQRRMFSWMFSKDVPPVTPEEDRRPFSSKNLLSIASYWWCFPVLRIGYKRTVTTSDLPYLTDEYKVEQMYKVFQKYFDEGNEKAKADYIKQKCLERGERPDTSSVDASVDLEDYKTPLAVILKPMVRFCWKDHLFACLFIVLGDAGNCCLPLLSRELISFIGQKSIGLDPGIGKGIGYAVGCSIMILVFSNFLTYFMYFSMMTGAKTKAVLTKAILEKSFRVDARAKHDYTSGAVTAFMSTDMAKIDIALTFLPFGTMFIVPLIVGIVVLAINIGVATAIGFGVLVFFSFVMVYIGSMLYKYRLKALKHADERISYIKEVVNNLKIIKFYSWEIPYFDTIKKVRSSESNFLHKMQYCLAIIFALSLCLTNITSMVAFLALYAIGGDDNTPAKIFSSLTLFQILSGLVTMLPATLGACVPALISLRRVGHYLGSGESSIYDNVEFYDDRLPGEDDEDKTVIRAQNASFIWEVFEDSNDSGSTDEDVESSDSTDVEKVPNNEFKDEKKEVVEKVKFTGLTDLNIEIKKNEFILVLGSIGTGKSSFLNALSGFMTRTSGRVSVFGSLLLSGSPWVQNATFKENVLFGCGFDQKRYDKIIDACALNSDIDILPAGDKTEIGERGVNLSGGQKARLSLARAVYADKDIILMDDVLSAVDARVGKHIMDNCILGLLQNKTRVLVTHQLSFVPLADRIIFLNGDGSVDIGTHEELSLRNHKFNKLLAHSDLAREAVDDRSDTASVDDTSEKALEKQITVNTLYNADTINDGKLIDEESRAINAIGWDVYKTYIDLGSGVLNAWVFIIVFVVSMALAIFCDVFTNTWLSFWLEDKFGRSDGFYIGIYIMLTFMTYFIMVIHLLFVAYLTISASGNLNILSTKSILHVPMSYMDTTPIGRILNRFTKDTDSLDNELISQLILVTFSLFFIIAVIILCIIYLPWFAIAVPFLGFIFAFVGSYYQASSREIKRLEAIQRSFVYNNFNECLTGNDVIKAYKDTDRFFRKSDRYINNMNEAYYMVNAIQRWLCIFLGFVTFIFVLLITLLSVNRVFNISAASAGLLMSYVLAIPNLSTLLLRAYTLFENEMNSAERMSEFAFRLPQERSYLITETAPPPEWPSTGAVRFENVSVSYRPGLPNVLKNVSLDVKPGERIGICGRTGAGKSSMTNVLFRTLELNEGTIWIDGIDISTLGLNQLRSKLSIIPQEAVLIRGNIRKNLDPFEMIPDGLLWEALRRAGLIESERLEHVKSQRKGDEHLDKFHLEATVADDGTNFSLGERQLIAFARALARNSKILVLDEATSSVDFETDSKIQTTIASEFDSCTILCIAHRLKTIINYDKILVLDQGEVKEFDRPWTLYQQNDSVFRSLCDKSKILPGDFDQT